MDTPGQEARGDAEGRMPERESPGGRGGGNLPGRDWHPEGQPNV